MALDINGGMKVRISLESSINSMKVGWNCGFGLPLTFLFIKSIIACRVLELKIWKVGWKF